jgi:hypothetical protein
MSRLGEASHSDFPTGGYRSWFLGFGRVEEIWMTRDKKGLSKVQRNGVYIVQSTRKEAIMTRFPGLVRFPREYEVSPKNKELILSLPRLLFLSSPVVRLR